MGRGGKRRGSLREAFGGDAFAEGAPRHPQREGIESGTGDTVNTAQQTGKHGEGLISATGEVEMVPGGRSGEMVPADKPVNMTFTVTAKERYLWTLELRRRGRSTVSVLRETMGRMLEEDGG